MMFMKILTDIISAIIVVPDMLSSFKFGTCAESIVPLHIQPSFVVLSNGNYPTSIGTGKEYGLLVTIDI